MALVVYAGKEMEIDEDGFIQDPDLWDQEVAKELAKKEEGIEEMTEEHWKVVTERDPSASELQALRLAWRVCKHARSNAIVFADSVRTLGIGAGQTSRVDAARIAIMKARVPLKGSSVASDAFLPFPDTLEEAVRSGATALVQPGGSIRDREVIETANRLDVAMIFTGIRHFRH
jgi:phosphoribosylaminoimidazolecarboxamide formyltransferase/IMP cyclohydrolase